MSSARVQPGALLEPLEAGPSRLVEHHDLAVEDQPVERQRGERARDLGKRGRESFPFRVISRASPPSRTASMR